MSNGWKVGIGYLPLSITDEAKVLMTEIEDENLRYRVMRLIEQTFAIGYEAAFVRAVTEQSWFEYKAKQADKST